MILVLTNSEDSTADYLCHRLGAVGLRYTRFNTDKSLASTSVLYRDGLCTLRLESLTLAPCEVSTIWFRRPEPLQLPMNVPAAEHKHIADEWSGAIEGFLAHVPVARWMNHPSRNACSSYKLEQLTRAAQYGLSVPKTLLTNDPLRLKRFWEECEGHIIVKPIVSGFLERNNPADDTHVYTNTVPESLLSNADTLLPNCPTLFQMQVQKTADIRINVVDDHFSAIALKAQDANGSQRVDIRRNEMRDVTYQAIDVPSIVRTCVVDLVRSYGLRFAAIDMAIDLAGNWWFFEINPNGQWAWLDLEGVTDIASLFIKSFEDDRSRPRRTAGTVPESGAGCRH